MALDYHRRIRKALNDVLYGGRQRLDVDRLVRLADAFGTFTTDGLAQDKQLVAGTSSPAGPVIDSNTVQALKVRAHAISAVEAWQLSSNLRPDSSQDSCICITSTIMIVDVFFLVAA